VISAAATVATSKNSRRKCRAPSKCSTLPCGVSSRVRWTEALDQLLVEERTMRENRRVKIALTLARLTTVKSLFSSLRSIKSTSCRVAG
jgi:hypothetical protein